MNARAFPFVVPTADATDDALTEALHACARRSMPALRRIYDLTAAGLLGELVQMLGDRQTAEAMLEDCFVQVWQQAGNFSPERCRPLTWLRSIARQQAIDWLRQHQHDAPPDETDPALRLLDAAMQEEPGPAQLRLLRLAYRSGRTPAEIARALDCPLQGVQTAIRRGLQSMLETPAA